MTFLLVVVVFSISWCPFFSPRRLLMTFFHYLVYWCPWSSPPLMELWSSALQQCMWQSIAMEKLEVAEQQSGALRLTLTTAYQWLRVQPVISVPTHRRTARLDWPRWLIPREYQCQYQESVYPQTITYLGNNTDRCRVRLLMCTMLLPLSSAATV